MFSRPVRPVSALRRSPLIAPASVFQRPERRRLERAQRRAGTRRGPRSGRARRPTHRSRAETFWGSSGVSPQPGYASSVTQDALFDVFLPRINRLEGRNLIHELSSFAEFIGRTILTFHRFQTVSKWPSTPSLRRYGCGVFLALLLQ